jgi:hypothetical protein
MGAILARDLAGVHLPGGMSAVGSGSMQFDAAARVQIAQALNRVFALGAVMAATGLVGSFFLPPVDFSRGVPAGAGEQMLAAEMTSLESESEPEAVARRL